MRPAWRAVLQLRVSLLGGRTNLQFSTALHMPRNASGVQSHDYSSSHSSGRCNISVSPQPRVLPASFVGAPAVAGARFRVRRACCSARCLYPAPALRLPNVATKTRLSDFRLWRRAARLSFVAPMCAREHESREGNFCFRKRTGEGGRGPPPLPRLWQIRTRARSFGTIAFA